MEVNQPFSSSSSAKDTPVGLLVDDYHIDLGACFSVCIELIKKHFAQVILAALISLACLFLIALPQIILTILIEVLPLISLLNLDSNGLFNFVSSYVDFILTPWGFACVMGICIFLGLFQMIFKAVIDAGTYYYFWRLRRLSPQKPSLKEIFIPFRRGFWRITGRTFLLAGLYGLIFAICSGLLAGLGGVIGIAINASDALPNFIGFFGCVGAFISLPIIYYFHISFIFSPLLILERNLGVWESLKLSRRRVKKHMWMVVLIWIVLGIIAFSGSLLCYVGLLVTYPFYYVGVAYLYDQMFRKTEELC